ncbi:hypothetical protein chiPu_0030139, partial [Chiloscyllium punctatum]|nr:hypothetical protein [Chiloscyllium punctatum]
MELTGDISLSLSLFLSLSVWGRRAPRRQTLLPHRPGLQLGRWGAGRVARRPRDHRRALRKGTRPLTPAGEAAGAAGHRAGNGGGRQGQAVGRHGGVRPLLHQQPGGPVSWHRSGSVGE